MSQRTVEGTLGRLITDSEFRRGFYADPATTCLRESLDLTTRELEALMALDQSRLQTFARVLDGRIVRAAVGGVHYWSGWASGVCSSDEAAKLIPGPSKRRLARAAR
jgi:hypothetical protein